MNILTADDIRRAQAAQPKTHLRIRPDVLLDLKDQAFMDASTYGSWEPGEIGRYSGLRIIEDPSVADPGWVIE